MQNKYKHSFFLEEMFMWVFGVYVEGLNMIIRS